MFRSFITVALGTIFFLTVTSCSLFSRKTEDHHSDGQMAATPLDVPKEKSETVQSSETSEPSPAALNEPQVTLIHKDGTPVTPAPQSAPEAAPAASAPAATTPAVPAAATVGSERATWSYEGDRGPEHWGDMKEQYAACRDGKSQSPIDLKWHKPKVGGQVQVSYKETSARVEDDGHTIRATFEAGSQIKYDGIVYDLMSMHFHSPSEHTLSGKSFPMEIHFINQDQAGNMVVFASFLAKGHQNKTIAKIWGAVGGSPAPEAHAAIAFNPGDLLPAQRSHYEYEGSLSSPPCTENVRWLVFNNPVHASENQVSAFQHLYRANARPTQPLNGRNVVNF